MEREDEDVLGPKDLVYYHKLDPHLPHNGIKTERPDGSARQAIRLSQVRAGQREILDEKRVVRFGSLSVGNWNQDLELIEVKSEKGKFWQTMGYNSGSKKYLYPEEGLYLMEMNSLELLYQGVPLSIQQAYELLMPSEFTLDEYQTYAHLMRLGYIVTRHNQRNITEYEHRIKLYEQHRHRQQRASKKVQVWFDQMAEDVNMRGNSDSGEMTDESYDSSASGSSLSLTGDLNTKVKQTQQDYEESKELEGGSGENNSVYSNGPLSELIDSQQKKDEFEFANSVNLLDFHQRYCTPLQNGKLLKRKHSPWYMIDRDSNCSISGNFIRRIPSTKIQKTSPSDEVQSAPTLDAHSIRSDHKLQAQSISEKDLKTEVNGKECLQSSDLGTSHHSLCDSLTDTEEFLQAVGKQIKQEKKQKQSNIVASRPYSVWKFSQIHIPDIGALKPNLTKKPGQTRTKTNEGRSGQSQIEHSSGLHTSESENDIVAPDGNDQVLKDESIWLPTNWMEYKTMNKKPERKICELLSSPLGHLWRGEVKPLVSPSDAVNPDILLRKLQVIQCEESKETSRYFNQSFKDVKIVFDVYLPNSTFKKTCHGKAAFHVVIFSVQDPVPDFSVQMSLLHQSGTVPVLFSIVDNVDVTFYCFKDVQAPLGIF